ncbi:MAG: rRNA cytosine-C5-methyltransferase [Micrococcales bacterium]|nr:MAG: rRNA cytosine-C5-methyltransferase [Micrococcales bacterium]PIE26776.1 MAG: rRNA cytosine-C5-methyltransferase [Micrococcales bacterium]
MAAARRAPARSRPRRGDPVRTVVLQVLREVAESDSYANLLLPVALRRAGLTGRDAALATELTYGTLRGAGTYDAILSTCVHQDLGGLDPGVLELLRLGSHQLLRTRIPTHAAVGETVALARASVGSGASGLVNAVLRKVAARSWDAWLEIITAGVGDPDRRLALLHAHPVWIVRALRMALAGSDDPAGELVAALAANNEPPRVTLLAVPGLIDVPGLARQAAAAGIQTQPGRFSPWALRLAGRDPAALPAVAQRCARVQDEGSQLVAGALAGLPVHGGEQHWMDLCAGPGGKTAVLAGLAPAGVRVTAVEPAAHRARLVEDALPAQLAGRVEVRTGDGRDPAVTGQPGPGWAGYDRVLVDTPCTGLGALRRRPEARWRRQPGDLAALGPLQRELLSAAVRMTRPGGIIAYTTCSPHPAETAAVVQDVLGGRDDVSLVDAAPALPGQVPAAALGPFAQLWTHRHGTDAMFLALLRVLNR